MKAYIVYDFELAAFELVTIEPPEDEWRDRDTVEVDLPADLIKKHLIAQEKWAGMQKSLEKVYLERANNGNGTV